MIRQLLKTPGLKLTLRIAVLLWDIYAKVHQNMIGN